MDLDALFEKANANLTASRSFGPVIERDGCTVIPAAYVVGFGGGGDGEGPSGDEGTGRGSGGGFATFSWPLGAYVVRGDQVRWVPALDATRVAIAALAIGRLAMKIRAARRLRELAP